MQKHSKIAYIGGGSKQWARVFMSDPASTLDLSGEIALYDIDREAAEYLTPYCQLDSCCIH